MSRPKRNSFVQQAIASDTPPLTPATDAYKARRAAQAVNARPSAQHFMNGKPVIPENSTHAQAVARSGSYTASRAARSDAAGVKWQTAMEAQRSRSAADKEARAARGAEHKANNAGFRKSPRKPALVPTEAAKKGRFAMTRGRWIGAGAGLATVGAAGGGYAYYRHRQRGKDVEKSLVNPFEEIVVFGKAYPVALPVPSSERLRAIVPTGGHIGHGRRLVRVHGGGPKISRTQLQTYHGNGPGLKSGPFGKADDGPKASRGRMAAGTLFPGIHGVAAGKKGSRARAAGNEYGGAAVGTLPGAAVSAAGLGSLWGPAKVARAAGQSNLAMTTRTKAGAGAMLAGLPLAMAGSHVGANRGTARAHRKGHYNPELNSNNPSGPRRGSRID